MADSDEESPSNKRTLAEEEGEDWTREPPKENGNSMADSEREPKRAKITNDAASQKRGKRMFGVLMGTLNKFRDEGTKQTDAAKRRIAIEERLAAKLKAEHEENERRLDRSRQEKQVKLDVVRKEEENGILDSIYEARHSAALNLANYLCTSHTPSAPPANVVSVLRPPVYPALPLSLAPSINSTQKPIYYLPARLLDSQRETLDAQLDRVRNAVGRGRCDWADERHIRIQDLAELREKRDRALQERRLADDDDVSMRDASSRRPSLPPRPRDDDDISDRGTPPAAGGDDIVEY